MTLMLQREVVDRIMAQPGSSDRGYLSVFVEAYCEIEKLFDVAPASFRPAPKVWSTVVRLRLRSKIAVEVKDVGSGASARPQREELMKAARRRELDAILVW